MLTHFLRLTVREPFLGPVRVGKLEGNIPPIDPRISHMIPAADIGSAASRHYPLIKDRLSFTAHDSIDQTREEIRRRPKLFFFSTDLQERYIPFCADFGPVDVATVVEFCDYLRDKMHDPRIANRHLVYYFPSSYDYASNAAFLLSAYLVIDHGFAPQDAVKPFETILHSPILPFRDATFAPSTFPLSITDCLRGLNKAMNLGWLDPKNFNIKEYDTLACPETSGDVHQICPKFVAFRGPEEKRNDHDESKDYHAPATPEQCLRVMSALQVSLHRAHLSCRGAICGGCCAACGKFDDSDDVRKTLRSVVEMLAVHCPLPPRVMETLTMRHRLLASMAGDSRRPPQPLMLRPEGVLRRGPRALRSDNSPLHTCTALAHPSNHHSHPTCTYNEKSCL